MNDQTTTAPASIWPDTCNFPGLHEHMSTALNADFHTYLMVAYGTSRRLIGGMRALLLASITHADFQGKSCEFRALNTDTRKAPKFDRKLSKADILDKVGYMERHQLLTPEQCTELRGKA